MKLSDLVGRKVEFFRAHIEPGILTMPKNALHHTDKDIVAMELLEGVVYVKTRQGAEFVVPWPNCQTIRLLKEEIKEPLDIKRGPGRPKAEELPKAQ